MSALVPRSIVPALFFLCGLGGVAPARPDATAPTDVAAATAGTPVPGGESGGTPLERSVKAAFLYKFTGYVEWPTTAGTEPDSAMVFGVMGDDDLADELTRMVQNRGPEARPVRVVKVRAFEPLPRLHVLFIGHGDSDRLGALIRVARQQPTLIVTDTDGALGLGSMINFVTTGGHVRFEVGVGAARRRGLMLSSRLIAVATSVSKRTP